MNLWILTEERPSKSTVEFIVTEFCKLTNVTFTKQTLQIKPITNKGLFLHRYETQGIKIEGVEKHFGHIKLDEPYYNTEDDEETTVFTHWWNTIDGEITEFSKGTLKDFIEWENLYNTEVFNEEEKYKLL